MMLTFICSLYIYIYIYIYITRSLLLFCTLLLESVCLQIGNNYSIRIWILHNVLSMRLYPWPFHASDEGAFGDMYDTIQGPNMYFHLIEDETIAHHHKCFHRNTNSLLPNIIKMCRHKCSNNIVFCTKHIFLI